MLPFEGSIFYYMSAHLPNSQYPRIVIIGAGFAGLRLAKKLSNKPFQVVLIDRNNFHQFQPLFYQVATAGLAPNATKRAIAEAHGATLAAIPFTFVMKLRRLNCV